MKVAFLPLLLVLGFCLEITGYASAQVVSHKRKNDANLKTSQGKKRMKEERKHLPENGLGIGENGNAHNKAKWESDTTHLLFSDTQIEKAVSSLKEKNTDILSPAKVALLGTLIGALSAISAQLIIFLLNNSKEKNRILKELIAEERSLSFQVVDFYKELAWLKVTYEFWYRSYSLTNNGDDFKEFLLARDGIKECKRTISATMAKYFKTITHFTNLCNSKPAIQDVLTDIHTFPPLSEESSRFLDIKELDKLNTASEAESERLKSEYVKLRSVLNGIYEKMIKAIQ